MFSMFLWLWLVGFFVFYQHISSFVAPSKLLFQTGVVFTGGAGRIQAGLNLLKTGQLRVLFISGVKKASMKRLILAKEKKGVVHFGLSASNTYGNVKETLFWLRKKKYAGVLVVTADYHMPRSRLLFSSLGRHVPIQAYPVKTPTSQRFWNSFREYQKYLWSFLSFHTTRLFDDYIFPLFSF